MAWKTVYLALGSNLGDREASLREAIQRLHTGDFQIRRVSSVYETAPMYRLNQPDFLNLVIEAETTLFPVRTLMKTARIERVMGRKRAISNGPRTIDIDIVLFGRFFVNTATLQIPHPRFQERRFVLEPLVELAPDLRHPVTKKPVRELLQSLPAGAIRRTPIRIDAPSALCEV